MLVGDHKLATLQHLTAREARSAGAATARKDQQRDRRALGLFSEDDPVSRQQRPRENRCELQARPHGKHACESPVTWSSS